MRSAARWLSETARIGTSAVLEIVLVRGPYFGRDKQALPLVVEDLDDAGLVVRETFLRLRDGKHAPDTRALAEGFLAAARTHIEQGSTADEAAGKARDAILAGVAAPYRNEVVKHVLHHEDEENGMPGRHQLRPWKSDEDFAASLSWRERYVRARELVVSPSGRSR